MRDSHIRFSFVVDSDSETVLYLSEPVYISCFAPRICYSKKELLVNCTLCMLQKTYRGFTWGPIYWECPPISLFRKRDDIPPFPPSPNNAI
jgi:hypothetical protein